MISRFGSDISGAFRTMFAMSFMGLAAIAFVAVEQIFPLPQQAVDYPQEVANAWGWK